MPDADNRTMSQSLFEGLFIHALKPDADFARELKEAGFDPKHQKTAYPIEVWNHCVAIAGRRLFPGVPEDEAQRKLGGVFLGGFFSTITGKLISVMLPLIGPVGLCKRFPRLWESGGQQVALTTREVGPNHWHFHIDDPTPKVEFDVGIFENAFKRAGVLATVVVTERRPNGFDADVTWVKK